MSLLGTSDVFLLPNEALRVRESPATETGELTTLRYPSPATPVGAASSVAVGSRLRTPGTAAMRQSGMTPLAKRPNRQDEDVDMTDGQSLAAVATVPVGKLVNLTPLSSTPMPR